MLFRAPLAGKVGSEKCLYSIYVEITGKFC